MWQSHGDTLGSVNKTPASQGYRWSTTTWQPQSWAKNKYSLVSESWWQLLRKWMLKLHSHRNTDQSVTPWQPPVSIILLLPFEWKWCWLKHVGWVLRYNFAFWSCTTDSSRKLQATCYQPKHCQPLGEYTFSLATLSLWKLGKLTFLMLL